MQRALQVETVQPRYATVPRFAAVRYAEPARVRTHKGEEIILPGEWLITAANGTREIMDHRRFEEEFRISEPALTLTPEERAFLERYRELARAAPQDAELCLGLAWPRDPRFDQAVAAMACETSPDGADGA
jgi:hypothetical protein